ncbi:DNA replication origin-binding helicase [Gallid alphaherpesvirus 1]|uniref:Replication origin-binding protein n=1 Tax=Infectious laryngotracheitis virus TaxID=10386 RepID=L7SS70_ILTV|nr:DNA replication origin-binding helicase [Gallid alphaherpesvirus 1]AGC23166.1 DNA replication origin-binding helicase [Gallid alphaherpesvirus 1]ATD84135.1 DNA replication origin-binding helicase [Gallid alphaherpesvirus 1]ATD84214.1 DNA replication origin-binding helicase [Gallid alphaherpesvirus 1]ATD84293.1 DNA replication origin-binding helicase [Gallid alphaherpesvirus 1]
MQSSLNAIPVHYSSSRSFSALCELAPTSLSGRNDMSPNNFAPGEQLWLSPSVGLARRLYGCDLSDRLLSNPTMSRLSLDQQHGHPVTFPPPSRSRPVLIARAPMGSGKTTALIEWLAGFLDHQDRSAIVVSCRKSFTNSLCRRFQRDGLVGFATYLDCEKYIIDEISHRRLLVQLESLPRVSSVLLDHYDVLVVDEVMSLMNQFFSPTVRKLRETEALFSLLLSNCQYIVAMDATINATLVEMLADLRGAENIHVIVNDFVSSGFANRQCTMLNALGAAMPASLLKPSEGNEDKGLEDNKSTAQVDPSLLEGSFFHEMQARLLRGENICVFSSTLSFSNVVAFFCSEILSPGTVLLLNSNSPHVDTTNWGRFRAVIYTTVVTVGLSFDSCHFHSMFAFVKPTIHGPDMMAVYQAMGRVRRLLHDKLFIYLDVSGAWGAPIFTPMILNSEFSTTPWPVDITVPADAMCVKFKNRCRQINNHRDGVFTRFKNKHYVERCTLTSANDSFSLLHTLLVNNKINVEIMSVDSSDPKLENLGQFISGLRADSYRNRAPLKHLYSALEKYEKSQDIFCLPSNPTPEETALMLMESENVNQFIARFFELDRSLENFGEDLQAFLQQLGDKSKTIDALINAAVVETGCTCDEDEWFQINTEALSKDRDSKLDSWISYYLDGPFVCLSNGRPAVIEVCNETEVKNRRNLLRLCINIARTIGWKPSADPNETEIELDVIVKAVNDALNAGMGNCMLEYLRLNITEPSWLTGPIRNLQCYLGEKKMSRRERKTSDPLEMAAVKILRTLWAELFDVRVFKSQKTFPGTARVKNLRKEELCALLDRIHVPYDRKETHKQLYAKLMCHREQFKGSRLSFRTAAWTRFLKGRCLEDFHLMTPISSHHV